MISQIFMMISHLILQFQQICCIWHFNNQFVPLVIAVLNRHLDVCYYRLVEMSHDVYPIPVHKCINHFHYELLLPATTWPCRFKVKLWLTHHACNSGSCFYAVSTLQQLTNLHCSRGLIFWENPWPFKSGPSQSWSPYMKGSNATNPYYNSIVLAPAPTKF